MATIPITIEINEEIITVEVPNPIEIQVGYDFSPFTQQNSDWNSTSGVTEILNKPMLGTASLLDVPETGDASPTQVVLGNDTRLSGGGGGVDSVTATHPVLSSGGTNPNISIPAATSLVDGYATSVQIFKLDGIADGAEVNVNADWNSVSGDSEILNKPTIPTQYTDELAQDAIGGILTNTSNVQFVYDDVTPKITASVDLSGKQDVLGFTPVPDTRTINGHILTADVTISKSDVGLSNVDNTSDVNKPISSATQTALDGKVDENLPITGTTNTKITFDSKGLVTSGSNATTSDIPDSLNKRYVTDENLTTIGNQSGINTGDNSVNSLYNGLATSKQDVLVSATNIKTINSISLLGSGDIAVQASLGFTPENSSNKVISISGSSTDVEYPSAKLLYDQLAGKQNTGSYLTGVVADSPLSGDGTSASHLTVDLSSKQNADAELTAIAGLVSAADKGIQFTGSGTAGMFDLTAAGKALLDDASASAQRTTLSVPALVSTSVTNNFVSFSNTTGEQKDSGKGLTHLVYTIQWALAGAWSPLDTTTYYFGGAMVQLGVANRQGISIPMGGTIIYADFCSFVGTTLATTENSSAWIRINDTTDTLISNAIKQDQNFERFSTNPSITVSSGNTFEIKWTTPAWLTNPTNTRQYGIIMIQT